MKLKINFIIKKQVQHLKLLLVIFIKKAHLKSLQYWKKYQLQINNKINYFNKI